MVLTMLAVHLQSVLSYVYGQLLIVLLLQLPEYYLKLTLPSSSAKMCFTKLLCSSTNINCTCSNTVTFIQCGASCTLVELVLLLMLLALAK
jgi:hypothetical protein